MNPSPTYSWKILGLLACTLAFTTCMQAQTTVRIRATDPVALEGTSTASFTLIRDGDTNSDLTVNLAISGTASNSVDYATLGSSVVIPAGYLAIDVPVQPIVDTVTRGNKTVILTLQTADAYTITGRGYATVKIVDDVFDIPAPSVTLTSPTDDSIVTAPAVVTLSADVDSQVSIQRVGFYVDDKLIATLTNAPYTITWSNSNNGKYTVFARAVDQFDKAGVSDTVHVTVSATPVVTVVSGLGSEFYSNQSVPLQAEIGDPNESISSVSFYVNKKLVGTVTTAPFIFYWSDNTVGTFNITAVATDSNTGETGTSPKLPVTVIQFVGGGD